MSLRCDVSSQPQTFKHSTSSLDRTFSSVPNNVSVRVNNSSKGMKYDLDLTDLSALLVHCKFSFEISMELLYGRRQVFTVKTVYVTEKYTFLFSESLANDNRCTN